MSFQTAMTANTVAASRARRSKPAERERSASLSPSRSAEISLSRASTRPMFDARLSSSRSRSPSPGSIAASRKSSRSVRATSRSASRRASSPPSASISVLISVLGESMALALIGGATGGLVAYAAFNGYQTSTMNFQTFSQLAFAFRVTPQLLVQGLSYALMMGFIGGVFPAIRAARLPIASALREL